MSAAQVAFDSLAQLHLQRLAFCARITFAPKTRPRLYWPPSTVKVRAFAWGAFDIAQQYADRGEAISAYTSAMVDFAGRVSLDPSALNEEWPDEP